MKQTLTLLWRKMFVPMTLIERMQKELREAELGKLEAQSTKEYAESIVTYHDARITRLKEYLKHQEEQGGKT